MRIHLFLFFLLLTACSQPIIDPVPIKEKKPTLMSEAEIKQAFASKTMQKAKGEFLNEKAKGRLLNIIPSSKFFTPKQLAKKKSKKLKYIPKGSADLRQFDSPIEDQWNGTCTAHGLRSAIDNLGHSSVSTRHIWDAYSQYSCEAAINAWTNKGCMTDVSAWPHNKLKPNSNYKDPKYCDTFLRTSTYIEDDLLKMKESLDKGNPVYLGITVTNSMLNCDIALNPQSAALDGGHALAIVGYKDDAQIKGGGYFIIKNSWGKDCADSGYQYVPYFYCQRKDIYCIMWTIDKVEVVSSPIPEPLPIEPVCIKWKRIWYMPWKFKCIEWSEVNVLAKD